MEEEEETPMTSFNDMGLDDRILKSIATLGWKEPTLIQEKAIPLALTGKDILARARTGSGKTAAFAIPMIQKILHSKQTAREQCIKGLVLTPTKELCNQAFRNIQSLCSSCSREVKVVDISPQVALDAQKPLLLEKPDIVVGTPSRVLAHMRAGNLDVKLSLEMVVIDEADLLFAFGYEENVRSLLGNLPKIYQAFLTSATLSADVHSLKKLVLHNAVVLKLEESKLPDTGQLTQYHIKCEEDDKFVLIYALLKLRLIRGKSIIFVNTIDKCYRLKLFFEQFAISSCVLNSELPVNSRCHIVRQFNEGLYDIIIAADEIALDNPKERKDSTQPKKRKRKRDQESGVARGIDFQNVSNVINFDFPLAVDSYVHRVGRTARGNNQGTALSFVSIKEMALLQKVETSLSDSQPEGGSLFKPYHFKMDELDGFRNRSEDAKRAVTRVAVREARLKEIKKELLTSQKLKSYFEDNPRDLQLLRHDKSLHTARIQPHLQHVPDYLVPPTLRHLSRPSSQKGQQRWTGPSRGQRRYKKRKADPLKSFEFAGLSGKRRKKKQ